VCREIRDATGNGKELVDYALRVFRGQPEPDTGQVPKAAERWEALEWLADRAFGKAVTPVDLAVVDHVSDEDDDFDLSSMTREQRADLERRMIELLAETGDTTVLPHLQ